MIMPKAETLKRFMDLQRMDVDPETSWAIKLSFYLLFIYEINQMPKCYNPG